MGERALAASHRKKATKPSLVNAGGLAVAKRPHKDPKSLAPLSHTPEWRGGHARQSQGLRCCCGVCGKQKVWMAFPGRPPTTLPYRRRGSTHNRRRLVGNQKFFPLKIYAYSPGPLAANVPWQVPSPSGFSHRYRRRLARDRTF